MRGFGARCVYKFSRPSGSRFLVQRRDLFRCPVLNWNRSPWAHATDRFTRQRGEHPLRVWRAWARRRLTSGGRAAIRRESG